MAQYRHSTRSSADTVMTRLRSRTYTYAETDITYIDFRYTGKDAYYPNLKFSE